MKKLFFVMAAVAALLTSCSKDDTFGGPTRGKVTFEVSTPELATRAYGDGQTAKILKYAVYDMIEEANGKYVDEGSTQFAAGSLTTTVSIDLVEGRKYSVIFWAESASSPYTFDEEAKTVSYTDVNALTANNENYDAFFAYVPEDKVKVGETVNVTLKRPFAQLNIATSDKVRAETLDVIVEQTAVEVQAYTTLNLVNGTVSGKQALKFALADDPNFQINVPVDNTTKTYDVLSTNYLLVNTSENVDVTFTFTDKVGTGNEDKSYVRKYSSIPVQRNYRTNVIGSILTDPTQFDVTIDKEFTTPDKNENVDDNTANNNTFGVATAAELQAALNAATDGATIYFTDDITGDVTATQKEGVKITILGQGHSYKGMITVDGKSAGYETAGLTIKDIVFNAESVNGDACIRLGNGNNNSRYTNNVTVDGCTFDVPLGKDNNGADSGVAGVKSYDGGDKNLTITNCTATARAHSLVQVNNVEENFLIKDCVANSKNGINLNQTVDVVIDNYTANVKGYAVRFGASSGGTGAAETYLIKNSSLKTDNSEGDAVIILRATADNSTLTIENTTIDGTTKIENNATNATIIINGVPTVSSAAALVNVVAKGYTNINLADGEYDMPNLPVVNGLKLMGESRANTKIKLYNATNGGDFCLQNSTATLENMTIITEIKDWAGFQNATNLTFNKCDFVNNLFLSGNATFNECHFTVTTNHYNVWAYSANSRNYTATFNTCVFDCAGKSIYIDGNAGGSTTMNFTGCTFNDNDSGATDKAAIETGTTYGAGATYNVNITGCTFDADGFAENPNGIPTGSKIWANKDSMGTDKLNVVIDGVEVY